MFRNTPSLLVFVLLSFTAFVHAEHLRPISGGTKTEADPKHKEQLFVIGESETVRVTVAAGPHEGSFRHKDRIAAIEVKIENRGDEPLAVDPTKFSLVDSEGRGYSGLTIDDAASHLIGAHQGMISFGSAIGSRPGDKGESHNTIENMIRHNLEKQAFQPGSVPPHSFKEGVFYVEAPEIKKGTVKLTLGGIWAAPIVLEVTD